MQRQSFQLGKKIAASNVVDLARTTEILDYAEFACANLHSLGKYLA
jgi:hypothetical protein